VYRVEGCRQRCSQAFCIIIVHWAYRLISLALRPRRPVVWHIETEDKLDRLGRRPLGEEEDRYQETVIRVDGDYWAEHALHYHYALYEYAHWQVWHDDEGGWEDSQLDVWEEWVFQYAWHDLVDEGRRTALIDPEDRRMVYSYDSAGNLTGFTDPDGYETTLGYDPVGRLESVSYPNGVKELRDYDEAGQLRSVATSGADGYLESYTYTYDERGFKTSQVEEDGATTAWAYDDAGRLIRVEYPVEKILSIKAGQETTRAHGPTSIQPRQ